ncbi:hypothetical protein OSTOST_06109 [Ostertagia ostertagi]
MSKSYCSRFHFKRRYLEREKMFFRWSCNSEHFRLAFRVCRQSCGFCTMDWRNSPEPMKCI